MRGTTPVSPPRHQRPAALDRFLFGACYYPEHWSPEERERDVSLMEEAGINTVRLAEFAWDLIEPQEGVYDFSLFDETISRLGREGIRSILCTPTAAPPRRLTAKHPDWLRLDSEGRAMQHGSRQHCCTTNPGFRAASRKITRAMAEHFAGNPNVIGWQTDNELHCHFSECHCAACEAAFREWARSKYGNIGALNKAWGTSFWAQSYGCFEDILLPRTGAPTHPNPSHQLDYFRFLSDATIAFQREQTKILREVQPGWRITHNGLFGHIDYWKFAGDLDFLGVDIYPGFAPEIPEGFRWTSLKLQECRAASGSFLVPEQQSGAGGQNTYLLATPLPGQMRLWAWQSVANGADGLLHFRWRTCRFGAETYWNGILDHDNIPRRRFHEFLHESREFQSLANNFLGTWLETEVAILAETDQEEAHATIPLGLPGPRQQTRAIWSELGRRHLPAGIVDARDSFEGLSLIILPSFPLMDEELAARLAAFVETGGTLVASARTAIRNRDNAATAETLPAFLSGVFGMGVEEFGKADPGEIAFACGAARTANGGCYEILSPTSAETLASWDAPPYHPAAGRPAATIRRTGKGSAIYIGTWFSENNVGALCEMILEHRPIRPLAEAPPTVEITCRKAECRRLLFLLNHDSNPAIAGSLPEGTELLSGQPSGKSLELPPFGVAVIRQN